MGGKKNVGKSREWEKERRDKLNNGFLELSKLLPEHDPSMVLSKKQILIQAAQYIRQLQEQNQQILLEGTNNALKIESERLKRRVAQLLLKTKLLVEALRSAGVPIPNEKKKKKLINKKQEREPAPGNQNKPADSPTILETLNTTEKVQKKDGACNNSEKGKKTTIKKPLKESNSAYEEKQGQSATSSLDKNKINNGAKTSQPVVVTVNPSPIINSQVVGGAARSVQHPIPVLEQRNILNSLGPGTLIMADGRIVSVPPPSPIVPQILVKPPVPLPTLIFLSNTKRKEKKEKLLFPKRQDITKTTFANKAPIPAIKTYRLESQPRVRKKKPPKKSLLPPPVPRPSLPLEPTASSNQIRNETINTFDKDKTESNPILNSQDDANVVSSKRKNSEEGNCDSPKVLVVEVATPVNNQPEAMKELDSLAKDKNDDNDELEANQNRPEVQAVEREADGNKASTSGKYTIEALFKSGEDHIVTENIADEREDHTEKEQDNIVPNSKDNQQVTPNSNSERVELPSEESTLIENNNITPEKVNDSISEKPVHVSTCEPPFPSTALTSVTESHSNCGLLDQSQASAEALKATERFVDRLYSGGNEGNAFKADCVLSNDFLRSKDIEKNTFMPIIDDVRLSTDFSNDLFNSLQVPSGGQHPESISPTAAFLLAFPLVSTSKNTESLAENEAHEIQTSTPTTILQIGNIEPPNTELFQAIDFQPEKNQKQVNRGKVMERFHSFELNPDYENALSNNDMHDKANEAEKKKDSSLYASNNGEYQNKNHRRNYEIRVSEQSQLPSSRNDVSISNSFQQTYSYPLLTSCNDYSSLPPPQYSIGDGKMDHTNVTPWSTNTEYSQHIFDKEMCQVQKNKPTSEKKSKADKSMQKVCHYNYSQSQYDISDKKTNKQQQTKPPVNWMTTPDSARNILLEPLPHLDIYTPQKEAEPNLNTFGIPSNGQNLFSNSFSTIEMSVDSFPEFCNPKKPNNNFSWSPSKSLLPSLESNQHLVIPSTLPTLVGDLALGITNTLSSEPCRAYENSNTTRKFENKKTNTDKQTKDERASKKRSDFVGKNLAPPNSTFLSVSQLVDPKCKKQQHNKPNDGRGCQKRHSEKNGKQQRAISCGGSVPNFTGGIRKDNDLNCMYPVEKNNSFVPGFLNPHQWNSEKQRGNSNYKGGSYSAESLIGVQQQQHQSHELNDSYNSGFNSYQTIQNPAPTSSGYFQNSQSDYNHHHQSMGVSHDGQQYQNCFNFPPQSHFPPPNPFNSDDYQGADGFGFTSSGSITHCSGSGKHQRRGKWREETKNGGTAVYQQLANTTTTLTNFNLSTIFPEMNDQRGPSSAQSSHMNSSFGSISSHNYPVHMAP